MWLNQDIRKWVLPIIGSIGIISIICFIIIGDVLGIACLFSNPTLTKTLFGIFLFCPATAILLVALLFVVWGGYACISDSGDGRKYSKGLKTLKTGMISSFLSGTFILVTDVIFLKVPFGIHLLFSYCFLLLLLFAPQVYRAWSAIPEEDKNTRFIALFIPLLEHIIPKQDHEEWMGLLKMQHDQLIEEGHHLILVDLETLKSGLGLIGGSLWLKADKFVSRWMTRAKKVFLG
ncbi:hypothetical protein NDA07_16545 [Microcoleus vaginatus DQ-U2]|uniref:hypothetical protein n=1 Tax=Microcoleus vaginatus TaxID=119532 RepID=UPI0016836070|nr:hypothetical protein [Microcoleus sp. FACHB-DQ6]